MKKLILLSIILGLKVNSISAQRLYGGVGVGYGTSMASENIASKIENNISQIQSTVVKGSFGKGINATGYFGYMFTPNIGAELGASYLMSSKYQGSNSVQNNFTDNTTLSANMFRIAPGIRITVGDKRIKPYIRIGALFRVFGKITITDSYYDIQNNTTTESEWKYSKGFSIGVTSGLGATFRLADKIALFAELNMVNQSWGPKKGKCTKYAINGTDNLSSLTPNQRDIDFLDNYTASSAYASQTAYNPRQQLRQYFPFSSIGLNIGIHFTFGKAQNEKK